MRTTALVVKSSRVAPVVLVALTWGTGCDHPKEPTAAAPAAAPAVAPAPAPAPAPPPPPAAPAAATAPTAAAPAAAAPAHPPTCEVELFAEIKTTAKLSPKQTWTSYVAIGDCLAADAHILGRFPIGSPPRFMSEVIAPWNSDLSLCVSAEEGPGKPSTLYGKAKAPFHAEARGEVGFHDIVVEVRKGPAHVFPKDQGPWRPEAKP